ncbi:unnamed protein product [Durusdinium trenchii]|uniref:NADP-dependent oxidoreductase domain-containing protein n=1 Tax=Durusdinium trenchii TaxID=1381693 RepID=A0ABP0NRK6_9DINO
MGKWAATPKKSLKKVHKTTVSPASLASGKVPQKGSLRPLICVVTPFANKAAIFTERNGRGVLAEAADACSLWAVFLIAGKDVGNFLHRLDQQLGTFMESRGTTWDAYIDEHCVKVSTSNGYGPLNIGVKNWSRAVYFAVEEPSNEVVAMINMLDDFSKWRLTAMQKSNQFKFKYLKNHLREFESPTSAKHLIGVVEFQGQTGLITLYGDGYVHRQGLQDYAEVVERDGRNEYVYSTGYVTLLRPVPEFLDVHTVRCWNALLDMPHLIGQKVTTGAEAPESGKVSTTAVRAMDRWDAVEIYGWVGERTLTLASGAKMPAIGIGMCCRPTAYHQESVYNTILWYLLQGGRHIDTAEIYGNHVAIGQALKEAAKRGVPREEVFLVTKVWPEDFGYDSTVHAVERMLQDLGVDYIDVVLMHAPRKLAPLLVWHMYMEGSVDEFYNHGCKNHVACRRNTWKAMSELKDQGKIRDLGVSNFQIDQMKELQALKLAPISVHQFQYHPWLPEFQQKVVEFCHANKIAITAYNSLGGFKDKDKALVIEGLKAVGKKHSRSTGQVLLRWALEKNVSVIPGTGNPKHIKAPRWGGSCIRWGWSHMC